MNVMKKAVPLILLVCISGASLAKLPALSEEAKAKAAEAAAKTAWVGKVDTYLLCKSQDRVAVKYYQMATSSGKAAKPAMATAACADPGAFVYTPPTAPGVAPTTASAAATAAVVAAGPQPPVKPIEAAGAHSPAATAVSAPSGTKTDAVVNPVKKP